MIRSDGEQPEPAPGSAPERPALLHYITSARWFGGKGRAAELTDVLALPWLTPPASWPAVRLEIAQITYVGGETELYQLPVSYRPAPEPRLQHAEMDRRDDPELGAVIAYDAVHDDVACRRLLDLVLRHEQVGDDVSVSGHLTDRGPLTGSETPEVFGGEQSNTSIMYGDAAMLKLFRRLEIGRNLDIEVHDGLSRSGQADVADLYGWIEGRWLLGGQPVQSDLGMLVQRFTLAEDGWDLALRSLRSAAAFDRDARDLGRALASIHRALAERFPRSQVSGGYLSQLMTDRLDRATAIVPDLAPHVTGLRQSFARLAEATVPVQRVHGDFHLGQTLRTPDGWKIIDFEGEPVRTLAERAAPDSIWRDVAGMLRSFDYAAASVPGAGSAAWAAAARAAFLDGYGADDSGTGATDDQLSALRAYEADKAIYEVVYEARNRPDWLGIPMAAVAALATDPAEAGE